MAGIKKETQLSQDIQLVAGVVKPVTFLNYKPNVFQIRNYSPTETIYIDITPNVKTTKSLLSIVAGGTRKYLNPNGVYTLYLLSNNNASITVNSWESDEMFSNELDEVQISVITNSTTTSAVNVNAINVPLPSGNNNIGKVTIDNTTSLPAGNNNIGHVNIDGIPEVEIKNDTGNPIPVSGTVSLTATNVGLNAGSNKVGTVDLDLSTTPIVQVAKTPTIYNITLTSANTEYSQVLPANTKKVKFSIIGGDNSSNYRYAYTTGKVATPTAPYYQYNSDVENEITDILLNGVTLYFACSVAGKILQMEVFV